MKDAYNFDRELLWNPERERRKGGREKERDVEAERERKRGRGRGRERILWKMRLNVTCGEHLCCDRYPAQGWVYRAG